MPNRPKEDELLDQIVDEMTKGFNQYRQDSNIQARLRTKLALRLQLIYLEAQEARHTNGIYKALNHFLRDLQLDPEGQQAKIEKSLEGIQSKLEQLGLEKSDAYVSLSSAVSRVFRQMK
jgi:hypothetical protein